jgi:hypothetical protein
MGAYLYGIFVANKDVRIQKQAKAKWAFSKIYELDTPTFKGLAILGHDIHHLDETIDFEVAEAENERMSTELAEFSQAFPAHAFVLLEEDEHGDISSYRGKVCQNGLTRVAEMETENEVFIKYEADFQSGRIDYYGFYDQRLDKLLAFFGLDANSYFAPINEYDFFADLKFY